MISQKEVLKNLLSCKWWMGTTLVCLFFNSNPSVFAKSTNSNLHVSSETVFTCRSYSGRPDMQNWNDFFISDSSKRKNLKESNVSSLSFPPYKTIKNVCSVPTMSSRQTFSSQKMFRTYCKTVLSEIWHFVPCLKWANVVLEPLNASRNKTLSLMCGEMFRLAGQYKHLLSYLFQASTR